MEIGWWCFAEWLDFKIPLQDQRDKKLYGESISWFDVNLIALEKENYDKIVLRPSGVAGIHPASAFPSAEGIHHYSEIELDRLKYGVIDIQNDGCWDSVVAVKKTLF